MNAPAGGAPLGTIRWSAGPERVRRPIGADLPLDTLCPALALARAFSFSMDLMIENDGLKCYTSWNSRERVRVVYHIAVRVLASGERALFLLDSRGCPLFYPTLFVTS